MRALVAWQRGGGRLSWLRALEAEHGGIGSWWSDRSEILEGCGLKGAAVSRLVDPQLDTQADQDIVSLSASGWRIVIPTELPGVAELPEPPRLLLLRGAQESPVGAALAVVGARRATGYGLRTTRRFVSGLASHGVVIVSGLARGIDGAAHEAALDAGVPTVAVLGTGPDVVYPPEHAALQERIAAEGLLVTEHLPGEPPRPHHFPRRNRLLVAWSRALLVVEARLRSGTLTSVRWAADLGRDVLVVPGPVDSPLSAGPLQLLREGATPVGDVSHVLAALGLMESGAGTVEPMGDVAAHHASAEEKRILVWLSGDGLDLDELVRVSGEAPGRLMTVLLALEVAGKVVREPGALRYRAVTAADPTSDA